jgi:predicted CXXCH cytochrome family protein
LNVDWSDKHLDSLDPTERHTLDNVRNVIIFEKNQLTCLTCHSVHAQSTAQHQQLDEQAFCLNCHNAGEPKTTIKPHRRHSPLCGY